MLRNSISSALEMLAIRKGVIYGTNGNEEELASTLVDDTVSVSEAANTNVKPGARKKATNSRPSMEAKPSNNSKKKTKVQRKKSTSRKKKYKK